MAWLVQKGEVTSRAQRVTSRGLSLSGKLMLSLSLFLAPLAFVTVQLVAEQQKAIAFANAERVGVVCLARRSRMRNSWFTVMVACSI